jgi:hypothetical protein
MCLLSHHTILIFQEETPGKKPAVNESTPGEIILVPLQLIHMRCSLFAKHRRKTFAYLE